jgi:hypothetical protein
LLSSLGAAAAGLLQSYILRRRIEQWAAVHWKRELPAQAYLKGWGIYEIIFDQSY